MEDVIKAVLQGVFFIFIFAAGIATKHFTQTPIDVRGVVCGGQTQSAPAPAPAAK